MYKVVEDSFDVDWEKTLLREPYDVELWLEYAQDKQRRGFSKPSVSVVFERALALLPGSYKLWWTYLNIRRSWIMDCPAEPNAPLILSLNSTFERCLLYMNKMPKIWLFYCSFLVEQRALTLARRTFDRALCALPSTQHMQIWDLYSKFAIEVQELPLKSAEKILQRWCQVDSEEGRASLIAFLKSKNRFADAAKELEMIVLSSFVEEEKKSDVRREMLSLFINHPEECTESDILLEDVVHKVQDVSEKLKLLPLLAEYFIRLGEFDHARQVFYDAFEIQKKMAQDNLNLKSYSQIFELYSQFEEEILLDIQNNNPENKYELDFRSKRLRYLIEENVETSSLLFLKLYPEDVEQRMNLARFYEKKKKYDALKDLVLSMTTGTQRKSVNGHSFELFVFLSKSYENRGLNGEEPLELGCRYCIEFNDLVELWRIRVERELSLGKPKMALQLLKEVLTPPPSTSKKSDSHGASTTSNHPAQIHRSSVLWNLYLDVVSNLLSFENVRAVYDQCIQLKICSILNVLNYCQLLRENNFHEDSYQVYEVAVQSLFPINPHNKEIWLDYLKHFMERFMSDQLERTRDLFEQCLQQQQLICLSRNDSSKSDCQVFFQMYIEFEQKFGFTTKLMKIFERWSDFQPELDIFLLWIHQALELFGAPGARTVFEKGLKSLSSNDDICFLAIRFAEMETKLGEYERSRGIYKHASHFADPKKPNNLLWKSWNDFEIEFGNDETFREMSRTKRNVLAHFSSIHLENFAPSQQQQSQAESISSTMPVADPNEIDI